MKFTAPFVVLACVLFEVATAAPARPSDTIHFPRHEDLEKRAPSWTTVGDDLTAVPGDGGIEAPQAPATSHKR
ncbi:uncharacterized protein B0H18DRAFT_1126572 [Fomitopsis serialis]|uniref:uncharacterized protein n=1 Tax=Fomitopsis serialis TaxID=139415 RepID=UPI0020074B38|nr:uncharacterized protein B0H18DRAFT_1126572 [Neoantrodia serialis]KAH9913101.1 hypothetical protein B0H18DRAFT_1126572 [Neoantrodia serialis]